MNVDPAAWSCSFCGKRGTDDTRFAGGLGALMCSDCMDKYTALFAAPENAGQKIVGWGDDEMTDGDMLGRLPLVSATDAQVDRYLRAWVAQIRLRHISYAEIGKALGVSRQAAWERFSRVVEIPPTAEATADLPDMSAVPGVPEVPDGSVLTGGTEGAPQPAAGLPS